MATHVVKKYSNRKLYDTHTKRYVTLEVIADLLRRGDEVRVVDRTSGDDITAVTLSQILLEQERNRRTQTSEPVLVDMVKERTEQLFGMLRSSLLLPREITRRAAGGLETGAKDIEHRVDDAINVGLRNLGVASYEEVTSLQRRVDDLSQQVQDLGAELERLRPSRRRPAPRS